MNRRQSLSEIVRLVIVLLFLAGCSTPAQSPTPLQPTSTPTHIPTREPTATILPTATFVPLTPTSSAIKVPGGVIIAAGTTQLIVYGQRTGTSEDGVHVVNTGTFDEVETQKEMQITLSGGGPPLFAFLGPQQFTNNAGETALANVSIGSTDNPNVTVAVLWTSDIDGTLPSVEPLSLHESLFSMQSGQAVEEEGWLELGKIWTSDSTLKPEDQQEVLSFFLFHHDEETFVLGFLPNYKSVFPPEDSIVSALSTHSGPEYTYLIRGFKGGTIYLPQEAMFALPLPILQVNYIERIK